ncbi:hypothetical protein ACFQAT_22470 [Undibacterium arcticum]|uniref:DUF4124 domain-containing protein n=1 Tax=Undibacterium arcticum TaxID=1762892 RepID=A0ABV7F5J5_9BURK
MSRAAQRGSLSLRWCAALVALFALGAMAALFALRFQRDPLAEAGSQLMRRPAVASALGKVQRQSQQAMQQVLPTPEAAIRKCKIGGTTLYSNRQCRPHDPGSEAVDLQDSRGFETSQPAPVAAPMRTDASPDLRTRMIERSIGN